MDVIWILAGIVLVLVIALVLLYNGIVSLSVRVDNAFSQIDVQLKRRYDLIPNLVSIVKAYAAHERTVFESVAKARASAEAASTMRQKAQAADQVGMAVRGLLAVAENYPEIKANENFQSLQDELSQTESRISYARQFYNDTVQAFNTSIAVFPNNIAAALFGFKPKEYFKADENERTAITMKL